MMRAAAKTSLAVMLITDIGCVAGIEADLVIYLGSAYDGALTGLRV